MRSEIAYGAAAGGGLFLSQFVARSGPASPLVVEPAIRQRSDFVAMRAHHLDALARQNGVFGVPGPRTGFFWPIITPSQADTLADAWVRLATSLMTELEREAAGKSSARYDDEPGKFDAARQVLVARERFSDALTAIKSRIAVRDVHLNPLFSGLVAEQAPELAADLAIQHSLDKLAMQRFRIGQGDNLGYNGLFLPETEALFLALRDLAIELSSIPFGVDQLGDSWELMGELLSAEFSEVVGGLAAWTGGVAAGGLQAGGQALGAVVRGTISGLGVPLAVAVAATVIGGAILVRSR